METSENTLLIQLIANIKYKSFSILHLYFTNLFKIIHLTFILYFQSIINRFLFNNSVNKNKNENIKKYKNLLFKTSAIISGFLLIITIFGCKIQRDETGSLSLDISTTDNRQTQDKTVLPDIDLEVNNYDVFLKGPGDKTLTTEMTQDGSDIIDNLEAGIWTITVTANNAENIAIGTNQETVLIQENQTVYCTIVVTPYEGEGILSVAAKWDDDLDESVFLIYRIESPNQNIEPLEFTMNYGTELYENNQLLSGYYTISFILYINGVESAGTSSTFLIVKDEITKVNLQITSFTNGNPVILIDYEVPQPIEISLTGNPDSIPQGNTFTVTAIANISDVFFAWYLDGEQRLLGVNEIYYTIPENLNTGSHSIVCKIFNNNGIRIGSALCWFEVSGQEPEPPYEPLEFGFLSPTEDNNTINSTIRNFTIKGTCSTDSNIINMEYRIDNNTYIEITNKSYKYSNHWTQEINLPGMEKDYTITVRATSNTGSDTRQIIVRYVNPTCYYIDFETGSDSNSGTSTAAPWKHCPGDANATGNVGAHNTSDGDIFVFKGGAVYRGKIRANMRSDSPLMPVVFDGDSGSYTAKWGTGKAIVEGTQLLSGTWNNYSGSIWYIDAPADYDFFQIPIYEDDEFLWFAQEPDPDYRLYHDNVDDFYQIPISNLTASYCTDSAVLNQTDPNYWNDAYIYIYHVPNEVSVSPITGFNPGTDTISFTANQPQNSGGYGRYALVNHISLIDEPGEYCFIPSENRIYIWPHYSDNPNSHTYTYAKQTIGFEITNANNVIIDSFIIQKYYAPSTISYEGSAVRTIGSRNSISNIIIRNNEVTKLRSICMGGAINVLDGYNIIVENNYIHDCQKNRAIFSCCDHVILRKNTIERMTSSTLSIWNGPHIEISDNIVRDVYGAHSSIMTTYECDTVLIARNQFYRRPAETHSMETSNDITIFGNVYDGNIGNWGGNNGNMKLLNNTMVEVNGVGGIMWDVGDSAYYISINNIIEDGGFSDLRRYNLYAGLMYDQYPSYGWYPDEGEIIDYVDRENDIFENFSNYNLHLRLGSSPAIDSGTDISSYLPVTSFPYFDFTKDIDGNSFFVNGKYNIGAYANR